MKVYTFSEARQQLARVLDYAQKEGAVRVARRDGRVFVIAPLPSAASPLAVAGVDLNMPKRELLEFIHESRRT